MSNFGKALEGLVVCDFSWVGAGPITTNVLGQCGADITEERLSYNCRGRLWSCAPCRIHSEY